MLSSKLDGEFVRGISDLFVSEACGVCPNALVISESVMEVCGLLQAADQHSLLSCLRRCFSRHSLVTSHDLDRE